MKYSDIFKRENPSAKYQIVKRLAQGGFAKVFLVKRLADEKQFALKFIEPKNKQDYNNIKNEVAIMMLCKEQYGIIRCIDAYDYFEKLWVFLELMDVGAITECLEEKKGDIDEKGCKYILR